ncbi:sigma-70 family RNA polymerase sigma factor [Anaerolineales bacterium]
MQRQLTDEQELALIHLAQNNPTDFSFLYEAYIERIYGYVFYRLNNQQDAEDVVSDIFMKIICNIKQYNPSQGSFSAWAFGIARNTSIDFFRSKKANIISMENIAPLPSLDLSQEERLMNSERSLYIRHAISKLSTRRQEVITLKYFAGLRNQEIAAVLKLDERTIASHLSRALKDLETALAEDK